MRNGDDPRFLQFATNNSALETAVNTTELGYEHAKSTSTIKAELQLQDTSVSPDPVPSNSGSALNAQTPGQPFEPAPQAAEGGASAIKIATLASLCDAAGQQVYDHAKRAASPAGSASQGPPNTLAAEDEAADAQNDVVGHAT
ncbi:hypothetical protein ISF_09542 [Cordyceps fumosorosea ARSEF 2679]|uniref:Uncharacterized protein n=1 Tax=Cordyceps fumosorosea (strain ARSEF 2679) TaxID=1081104 RepID=A0A167GVW8_CORFA|nr:hypothetical protein ISF_09542 [Cordyceps fumosorosea ARSEF 2679]OAA47169.1 hypothetical protein ISF_09542 [Cordyceps fumosorosea ARSEF 2679]